MQDDSARSILTRLETGGGNRAGIPQGTPSLTQGGPSLTQRAPGLVQAGPRVASAATITQALIRSMLGLGSSISPDTSTPVVSTRAISTRKNSTTLEVAIGGGAQPAWTSLAQSESPAGPDASSGQALIRSLLGVSASISSGVGGSISRDDSTGDVPSPDNSTRGNSTRGDSLDLQIPGSAELTSASLALAVAPDASEASGTPALIRSSLGAPGAVLDGGSADGRPARPSDTKSVKKTAPTPARAGSPKIAPPSAQPSEVAIGRASRDSASGDFAMTDMRDGWGANGADGATSRAGSEPASGSTPGPASESNQAQAQIAQALELARSPMPLTLAPLAFGARLTPVDDNHFTAEPSAPDAALASLAPIAGTPVDAEIKSKPAPEAGLSPHAGGRADSHDDSTQDAGARVAPAVSPGDSARAFENPTPAPSSRPRIEDVKVVAAFGAAADALRASESRAAEPPSSPASGAPGASPVQEIALRIAQIDRPALDLRVTERAGEIQVTVRTPDAGLETALRQDLGTLTSSLERAGYRTETFVPRESAGAPASGALNSAQSPNLNSGEDREKQQPGSSGRQSGDPGGHPQQKRQRDPRPQDWLNEMENQA
jgi:hypothetical protein